MKVKSKANHYSLPVTSFITGLLSLGIFTFTKIIGWVSTLPFGENLNLIIGLSISGIIGIGLPVAAIVCGSIDLKKGKREFHKNKVFKALDITGIVLASIILFLVILFISADLLLSDR